jgi:hypothetical protein
MKTYSSLQKMFSVSNFDRTNEACHSCLFDQFLVQTIVTVLMSDWKLILQTFSAFCAFMLGPRKIVKILTNMLKTDVV